MNIPIENLCGHPSDLLKELTEAIASIPEGALSEAFMYANHSTDGSIVCAVQYGYEYKNEYIYIGEEDSAGAKIYDMDTIYFPDGRVGIAGMRGVTIDDVLYPYHLIHEFYTHKIYPCIAEGAGFTWTNDTTMQLSKQRSGSGYLMEATYYDTRTCDPITEVTDEPHI